MKYQLGEWNEEEQEALTEYNNSRNMIYKSKPVEIEAIQWSGDNFDEIRNFCETAWLKYGTELTIPTLEGEMKASIGDFIIKGLAGEFYPCKPEIFNKKYEKII